MKSANSKPAAEPIMMLGGSPMSVAVPPMLDASISAMKNGTGFTLSSLHSVSVTGPMSSTVVTLSKNAENTAVSSTNSIIIFQGLPLATWAHFTAMYSNMPESFTTATNSIMPNSTPSVFRSRCPMAVSNGITCSAMSSTAPAIATKARCTFSEIITASAMTNTATDSIWFASTGGSHSSPKKRRRQACERRRPLLSR